VLRPKNSFQRSFFALPIIVGIAVAINLMLLITKGAKNQGGADLSPSTVQLASWLGGLGAGLIIAALMPILRKRVCGTAAAQRSLARSTPLTLARMQVLAAETAAQTSPTDVDSGKEVEGESDKGVAADEPTDSPPTSWFGNMLKKTVDHDIHAEQAKQHDSMVDEIHARAEVFDVRTEESFKYLQVFTAACNSLSHGANDVANAIGAKG